LLEFLVSWTQILTTFEQSLTSPLVFNIDIVGISWCFRPKFQRLLNFSAPLTLTLGGLIFRTRHSSF
jgi:hypothetical protein